MSLDVFTLHFGDGPVKIEHGSGRALSSDRQLPERAFVYPEDSDSDKRPMQVQDGQLVRIGRRLPREKFR